MRKIVSALGALAWAALAFAYCGSPANAAGVVPHFFADDLTLDLGQVTTVTLTLDFPSGNFTEGTFVRFFATPISHPDPRLVVFPFLDDEGTANNFHQEFSIGWGAFTLPGIYRVSYSFLTAEFLCENFVCEAHDRAGAGSLDFTVQEITTTPLPGALSLFAGGLGLMGWLARRKKRNSATQQRNATAQRNSVADIAAAAA